MFPLGWKFRGIHQLHAGGDLQTASTTYYQQPAVGLHGGRYDGVGAFEVLLIDIRCGPAWVVGADHPIVPFEHLGQRIRVLGIYRHGGDLRMGGHLADIADDGGDVMAAADGLVEDG